MHLPLPRLRSTGRLASVFFSLAALAPLRADELIDSVGSPTLGTAGAHTVSGSGTTLTIAAGTNLDSYNPATDDLLIGLNGTGTLTVTAGATVSVPGTGVMVSDPINGDYLAIGGTLIGFASGSSGTLNVSGGATFSSRWLQLGTGLNSTGTLNVSGTGSTVTTGDYGLGMYSPTSSANISAGATLNTSAGDTYGSLYVSGGSLTVSSGAHLITSGLTLDTINNPQAYLDAGLTDPGVYSATLTATGTGTTVNSSGNIELYAASQADTVSLTLADHAALTHTGDYLLLYEHTAFAVNDHASASLTGGLVVGGNASLGLTEGSTLSAASVSIYGAASVSDSGTTLTTSALEVSGGSFSLTSHAAASVGAILLGYPDLGTLTVSTGATLQATSLTAGVLGDGGGAGGTLHVTGTGSAMTIAGNTGNSIYGLGFNLIVDDHASFTANQRFDLEGTVTVASGGTIASTYTGTSLNYFNGDVTVSGAGSTLSTGSNTAINGDGTLTVTDHGTFNTATNLQIGNNTGGTLLVSAGGTVNTHGAVVGYYSAFTNATATAARAGHATVTGAGSTWNNTGTFTVGNYRPGDLTVSAGGVLNNTGDFKIGGSVNATVPFAVSVLVTGAGSALTTTGALNVGDATRIATTATLTIADHGLVTAASTTVNSGDTLTLGSFGTLDTAALTVGSGGTVLAHDAAVFAFDLGAPSLTAPLTFGAGSTFTADNGASVYLLLNASSGFTTGTYALFSFASGATLTGVSASTFEVATAFGGYSYTLDFSSSALLLNVTESPGASNYAVSGLTTALPPSAVPEPSTYALLASGLVLLATGLRRRRPV